MDSKELGHVLAAVLILFVVASFSFVLKGEYEIIPQILFFAFIIIAVNVFAKVIMAYLVDASVEHRIWHVYRFGVKPGRHFKKELPFGVILPLVFSVFSLGVFKLMTFLSYETRALKYRAAKRFGYYSHTEMTDWHNGLIGAAGIVALLILSAVSYIPDFEYLSKLAAYYAFFNMLPISNLDGTQIFFGSRIIWTVLAFLSLIFALYALFLLGV
ncbi:hypothetical protein HYV50_01025 [Candidatus Pacearchaeota archaeon]|nr:hypothetical protein [Candidatus Pacearchaeota archaeon]